MRKKTQKQAYSAVSIAGILPYVLSNIQTRYETSRQGKEMMNVRGPVTRTSASIARVVLSVALATSLVPMNAYAAEDSKLDSPSALSTRNATDASSDALVEGDFEYALSKDGTAIITGYHGAGGEVRIPETIKGVGVTQVGESAFRDCASIESVYIPGNVKTVGAEAFRDCTSLKDLTISEGVERIDRYAFCNTAVEEVVIPASFKESGWRASLLNGPFAKSALRKAVFAEGTTTIVRSALENCDRLKEVVIPESVTTVDEWAFARCASLESVDLPEGLSTIKEAAFFQCSALSRVELPAKLSSIGNRAFEECLNLTALVHGGSFAHVYCLENEIPYEVIGTSNAFTGNSGLEKATVLKTGGMTVLDARYELVNDQTLTPSFVSVYVQNLTDVAEVYRDGVLVDDWTCEQGYVKVPANTQSGQIRLVFNCNGSSQHTGASAFLEVQEGSGSQLLAFGQVDDCSPYRHSLQKRLGSNGISFYGKALPNTTVTIRTESGELLADTTADGSGSYAVDSVVFPDGFASGNVVAEFPDGENGIVEKSLFVNLSEESASVLEFEMEYRGERFDFLSEGKTHYVYVNPFYHRNAPSMNFSATFDEPENVIACWVTNDTTSGIKYIPMTKATVDGEERYFASGLFTEKNELSSPGQFGIEYITSYDLEVVRACAKQLIAKTEMQALQAASARSAQDWTEPKLEDFMPGYMPDEKTLERLRTIKKLVESGAIRTEEANSAFGLAGDAMDIMGADKAGAVIENTWTVVDTTALIQEYEEYTGETLNSEDYSKLFIALVNYGFVDSRLLSMNETFLTDGIIALAKGSPISGFFLTQSLLTTLVGTIAGACNNTLVDMVEAFDRMRESIGIAFGDSETTKVTQLEAGQTTAIEDPSGIVYEALPSNTLEGVTASIWYKPTADSEPQFWNAIEFDQANPQTTSANGAFAWNVPQGLWQVRFEKSGYHDTQTDWLEVPPARTGLEVAMVSKSAPEVISADAASNAISVQFSQYMDVQSILDSTAVSTGSSVIPCNVIPIGQENGLSKTFVLVPGENHTFAAATTLTFDGANNYAGTPLSRDPIDLCIQADGLVTTSINGPKEISVSPGESKSIDFTVEPKQSASQATSEVENEDVATATASAKDDGTVTVTVEGKSPGMTKLSLNASGISFNANVRVVLAANSTDPVEQPDDDAPSNPDSPYPPSQTEACAIVSEFDPDKGTVVLSENPAREGDEITVAISANQDYVLKAAYARTKSGKVIALSRINDLEWTFIMPGEDVTLHVEFDLKPWENPYSDVAEGDWFYDAVRRASLAGLMHGYGDGTFGPDDGLAREQAATVMWNLMGRDDTTRPTATHSDVVQGEWYAPQVNWAVDAKVMDGYDAVTFGVGDELTREQFAAVIAKAIGADVDSADQTAPGAFQDADGVSDWAQATMAWAVETGVLNGVEKPDGSRELQPTRTLTRAEMATMMMNAIDKGILKLDA